MKVLSVKQSLEAIDELFSLACGPENQVHTYIGCIVNEVRFHTKDCDDRRITQNSGIFVSGEMMVRRLIFMVSYQMWLF